MFWKSGGAAGVYRDHFLAKGNQQLVRVSYRIQLVGNAWYKPRCSPTLLLYCGFVVVFYHWYIYQSRTLDLLRNCLSDGQDGGCKQRGQTATIWSKVLLMPRLAACSHDLHWHWINWTLATLRHNGGVNAPPSVAAHRTACVPARIDR